MRRSFVAAVAVWLLGAGLAQADPVADATAGQQALSRGDNPAAIALFTRALTPGGLSPADRESALVLRGQAYLADHQAGKALLDAKAALALNPGDADAQTLEARAGTPGGGPSLAETLAFVKDAAERNAHIAYSVGVFNSQNAQSYSQQFDVAISNMHPDPKTCQLVWHDHRTRGGEVTSDNDRPLDLKILLKADVLNVVDLINAVQTKQGTTHRATSVTPDVYVVQMHLWYQIVFELAFADRQTADQVADALNHAAQLCTPKKATHARRRR